LPWYVGTYRRKETSNEIDIDVEDIDTKEVMESDIRLGKITDYILAHHNAKPEAVSLPQCSAWARWTC
jgi:type I restriction enzyme R subunit